MNREGLNIEQNLQTVQRLSPRQVQFVRLLEMSGPEIEEEVQRQLDDNPALERADESSETADNMTDTLTDDSIANDPDDDPADYRPYGSSNDRDSYMVRQIAEDGPDLYASLMKQLGETELDDLTRQIAAYIIGNIDENGYLTRTLSDIKDDIEINTGIEISDSRMREAFDAVRAFDPAGVCAVDLRDCLLLQLNRMKPLTLTIREARDIVSNYFDLLSKKHLDRLQSQVGINDKKEMQAALELIRTLNPKPGSSIAPSQSAMRLSQIAPDVGVELRDDGKYSVYMISNLPQLQIERTFAVDESSPDTEADLSDNNTVNNMQRQAQVFIKLKRDDAEAFISALKQRSSTLLAVTEAIVKLQPEFFATGEMSKLRPMILKDVAEVTGLDISVISRATAGKYVATSSGIYPLKMFFNEAPTVNSETSSHQLMHVIQQIIDEEDKRHPLSDEAIRESLIARGHDVARRTVTKYREKLGLPVGRLRKGI